MSFKKEKSVSFVVEDFNNRPHISLGGLTPNACLPKFLRRQEAEQNVPLNKEQLCLNVAKATEKRQQYNQTHRCGHCEK